METFASTTQAKSASPAPTSSTLRPYVGNVLLSGMFVRGRSTFAARWGSALCALGLGIACGGGSKQGSSNLGGQGGDGSGGGASGGSSGSSSGGGSPAGSGGTVISTGGTSSGEGGVGATGGSKALGGDAGGGTTQGGSAGTTDVSAKGGRAMASGGTSSQGGLLNVAGAEDVGGEAGAPNGECPKPTSARGPPSCLGLPPTCGPQGDQSCCDSPLITGGQFHRINDTRYPATVSDFRLDRYEVTIGRFQNFLACYRGNLPATGSGKNPNTANDPGWNEAWNGLMPADAKALTMSLRCGKSASVGNTESRLPVNCVDWYMAFAFCIWDGGRLPTEAEWNYAAAGGDEQRLYPWSSPPSDTTLDAARANLVFPLRPVGSTSPIGDGRWGQADLAGNVQEWVVDYGYSLLVYPVPCSNCINLTNAGNGRGNRGGGAGDSDIYARTTTASSFQEGAQSTALGVRCARAP